MVTAPEKGTEKFFLPSKTYGFLTNTDKMGFKITTDLKAPSI
jgi:hypothetical protein